MEHMSNESFGRRIARLRLMKGMTQERLANLANVSAQAVSKWENDLSYPDIMLLPVLADVFGVSVDELLGRTVEARTVVMPQPEPEPVVMKGDVDFDEAITSADALMVLRVSALLDQFEENETKAADVDEDGSITSSDAINILRVATGLDEF